MNQTFKYTMKEYNHLFSVAGDAYQLVQVAHDSDYESDFDSDGEDENEIFDMIAKY